MKRRREMEKARTEIRSAIEELSLMVKLNPAMVKPNDCSVIQDHHDDQQHDREQHQHHGQSHQAIPTRPFLSFCTLVVQVLDKIGPTMAVLRQDIHQNIQRLETVFESEPSRYSSIDEILKMEAHEGIARKTTSCSRAFVWLTRSMEFTVALLQRLAMDPGLSMEQAVEDAYAVTLKPWHGWISSAAFRVATKLVPDNKTFIDLLAAKDQSRESLVEEMQTFISLLAPFLEEIHSALKLYSLERIKST
ncbi:hypothetical protein CDL15_Pgr024010 [Punica granatum]|uniref:Glycolipid transfer protein domain-containing protein n=1 Tax=Punica granatum TaxID=22663 RepID=A0A218XXG8_PUNGR|nr:hypothetical protein CDL15_Pgr024010 [Punica granatum]